MPDAQPDLLLKKIASAHFDISIYPHLEDLANYLAQQCLATLGQLTTGASLKLSNFTASVKEGQCAFETPQGERVLCLAQYANENDIVFVSYSSNFAASLSDAILGGPFTFKNTQNTATSIDVALLSSVTEKLLQLENEYAFPIAMPVGQSSLRCVRPVSVSDNEVKDIQGAAICNFTVDLEDDSDAAHGALSFHFPMEYLEARGLLSKERKRNADLKKNLRWAHDMNANINSSELEVEVILDTFKSQLSELAALEVGQFISLSENPDKTVKLLVATSKGHRKIGTGQLGAYRNVKAAKVSSLLGRAE